MRSTILAVVLCLAVAATPGLWAQGCPPPPNIPIGNCAPKAGTPTNFTGDTGPMRVRKSIYTLTPAEVKELRLAFQRLRALPKADPRSWLAQANVHCWNCSGDNSTAPDVHGNWAFMPWHRDYLYVLEKVLGSLVEDPKFALPYWDWNTPDTPTCSGHLQVPPPYLGTPNSLFDCYRGISATSKMSNTSVGAAKVNAILTNANTFALFFGSQTVSAALWPGPHGYVHLWTGDPVNLLPPKQDMGVLETASRDPLFWAHHANIDRLWDVWIAQHGTPAYPPDFLAQSWTFWNQHQKLIRITADDASNRTSRLHYSYAAPCSQAPRAGVAAEAAEQQELMVLTPEPQTVRTAPQAPARTFKIGGATGTHVVVNLEAVTVPADQGAILRVYVNEAKATASTGGENGKLVDEIFLVPGNTPGTGHHQHYHSYNLKLVLPEELAAEVEAAKGEVPITIVPVAATSEGLLTATPAGLDVKLKRPYITVE
jgi:polyphenol oxidase